MQLHTLRKTHKNKEKKRVGRGGVSGKTSGRGTKGQNARAGHKKRPEIRDFIKRLPKMRGRGKNINTSVWTKYTTVTLAQLNTIFTDGAVVTSKAIIESSLFATKKIVNKKVKILASGELTKKLSISDCLVTKGAKEAIIKAGGSVN